jgi:hypothetical protein
MTEKEFRVFLDKYYKETILPTLATKGMGQYSTPNDRFHNFNQLQGLKRERKEKNLTDLVGKQIVCLYDQMYYWEKENIPPKLHLMDELIKDIIIYMFILRAMFYELGCDLPQIKKGKK